MFEAGAYRSGCSPQFGRARPPSRLRGHRRSALSSSPINNHQNRRGPSASAYNRKVEQKFDLMNALDNLFVQISDAFKPISDFFCKHCSWENIMKFGRDTMHQVEQEVYEARIGMADSDWDKTKLKAKKRKARWLHQGQERVKGVKNSLKKWFS